MPQYAIEYPSGHLATYSYVEDNTVANWQAAVQVLFTEEHSNSPDVMELHGIYIDISGLTNTADITIQVQYYVNGAYDDYGAAITVTVGTDSNLIPVSNLSHIRGIRIQVQSNNAGDNGATIRYGYIKIER